MANVFQAKEQDKKPQENPNEVEIGNLSTKGMNGLRSPLESRRVSLGAQEWPKWS